MKARPDSAPSIDAYIAAAPEKARPVLEKVRRTIARAAPGAEEAISYAIPTFKWHGNLIHFAAYEKHIGVYPAPRAAQRDARFAAYVAGKGTLRFPLGQPIPFELIAEVVELRVKEVLGAGGRTAKKAAARSARGDRSGKKTSKPGLTAGRVVRKTASRKKAAGKKKAKPRRRRVG